MIVCKSKLRYSKTLSSSKLVVVPRYCRLYLLGDITEPDTSFQVSQHLECPVCSEPLWKAFTYVRSMSATSPSANLTMFNVASHLAVTLSAWTASAPGFAHSSPRVITFRTTIVNGLCASIPVPSVVSPSGSLRRPSLSSRLSKSLDCPRTRKPRPLLTRRWSGEGVSWRNLLHVPDVVVSHETTFVWD